MLLLGLLFQQPLESNPPLAVKNCEVFKDHKC